MTKKQDGWLSWLFGLCQALPVFYGLGCTVAEYDAKHQAVEDVPGGTVTRALGVSTAEFYEYLPGLYWLTVFGPQLASHFGPALHELPHTSAFPLDSAGVALLLDEAPVPQDMNGRLRAEAELRESLGPQYFFDRTAIDANYAVVPALARALRELDS